MGPCRRRPPSRAPTARSSLRSPFVDGVREVVARRRLDLLRDAAGRRGWGAGGVEAEVVEDAGGHLLVGDEGDEAQTAAALGAGEDVDVEGLLEEVSPGDAVGAQRRRELVFERSGRWWRGRFRGHGCGSGRGGIRDDAPAQAGVRGEDAVVAQAVDPRRRDEGGELGQEALRRQRQPGRAVARPLHPVEERPRVPPHAVLLPAPVARARPSVVERAEPLTAVAVVADGRHRALDAGLVLGAPDARVVSMRKPRAWAYSRKASTITGAMGSACATIALVLSGMRTLKTPPKKSHAASHAWMADSVVSWNIGRTKRCREWTAVKIHALKRRRLPNRSGSSSGIQPVSTCSSAPG